MSYYVEYLLLNRDSIRNYAAGDSLEYFSDDYSESDLTNGIYLDLLTLEKEINKFESMGLLTPNERKILVLLKEGKGLAEIIETVGLSKPWVYITFSKLCEKLGFSLGDYFTNEGFYEYMVETYKLTEEEDEKLKKLLFRRNNE